MLRLAADENFNSDIVRGLLRNRRTVDIVRIQDTEVTADTLCSRLLKTPTFTTSQLRQEN